jgi:ligand-binding SRPBCC domain-containing protein
VKAKRFAKLLSYLSLRSPRLCVKIFLLDIMPIIKLQTVIKAPIERVFDLARCIDLHAETMRKHNEKAIDGVTKGLINLDETVTWEATHFGVRQRLTSKITAFNPPNHFRDTMISGAFKKFTHDHFFTETNSGTLLEDVFDYESPSGIFGRIADKLFLETYMRKILTERNFLIKQVAESDEWQKFFR